MEIRACSLKRRTTLSPDAARGSVRRPAIALAVGLAFLSQAVLAQVYTNRSSVSDALGRRATAGAYVHTGAGGQSGGIAASLGATYHNQAGFLNTFIMQPSLDTDADGLPDEADSDNDNDRLTDSSEIEGTQFSPGTPTSPNLSDTDSDGMPDGDESAAGTDPTDPDALLKITRVTMLGGANVEIEWLARGGKTYLTQATSNLVADSYSPIATNVAAGGSAPWFVTTNTVIDPRGRPSQFYRIEVQP